MSDEVFLCEVCKQELLRSQLRSKGLGRNGARRFICRSCDRTRRHNNPKRRMPLPFHIVLRKREEHKRYKQRHAIKNSARNIVYAAVKAGALIKPDHCTKPDCNGKPIEGHHGDYSKPLDVIWLCHIHHVAIHYPQTTV